MLDSSFCSLGFKLGAGLGKLVMDVEHFILSFVIKYVFDCHMCGCRCMWLFLFLDFTMFLPIMM